jgi:DNA-binding transcriptional LysR family regulator
MSTINLGDLALFIQVVEKGSFTQAARYCDVPKSTLSRRISDLETRLGVRLLRRSTRKIILTESGEEFYRRGLNILREVDETERVLQQQRDQAAGKIVVCAPVMFDYLFVQEITAVRRHNPDVVLELRTLDTPQGKVSEYSFDILLHPGEPADSSLIARHLAFFHSDFFASPDYLQATGVPETPAQLTGYDTIYLDPGDDQQPYWLFDNKAGQERHKLAPKFIVDSPELATGLCQAGLGVARLPDMLANPLVRAGCLKPLLGGAYRSRTPLVALYHDRELLPDKIRWLISHMQDTMQEKIDQLEQVGDCSS